MKILTRYVLVEFLVPLFYCMTGFLSIYVLFDLFASFSHIVEAKMSFAEIVSYFCGYLAPYIHYMVPAALMLASAGMLGARVFRSRKKEARSTDGAED